MKTTTLALAALLAFGGVGASLAQQPGPPPAGREGPRMQRPDPAQMAERRAQRLRDTLQLRPDQEPALRAFIESSQPQRDRMAARREMTAPLTTPQRLDLQRERMAERMAQFERRAAATKRFYGALSPSQQKAFDTLHQGGRGRGGPGHRGGRGGGRMGPGPGPR